MISVSNEFKEAISTGPDYGVLIEITTADGSVVTVQKDQLWDSGFVLESATASSGSFDLGAAIIGKLTIRLNNMYKDFSDIDFTGAEITKAQIFLELSNRTETIDKGRYIVDTATYDNGIITLECLDNMHKFDLVYTESSLAYPATALAIIQDACSCCGVSLATDSLTFSGYKYIFTTKPDGEETTFRDILSWVGQCTGNYWLCNGTGQLHAGWYDAGGLADGTDAHTLGTDVITDIVPEMDDVVVTGVKITTDDAEGNDITRSTGSDGYVLEISDNDLITDANVDEIIEMVGMRAVGLTFRPASITCLQDPTIEAGDGVIASDAEGNTYKTFITNVTFYVDTDTQLTNDAEAAIRNSAQRFSKATKAYQKLKRTLTYQKTEFESALEKLQTEMDAKQGLYPIKVTESDGSMSLYFCDTPKLEDATTVIKLNASGWGMSTDGGATWNSGALVDGTMIAKIVESIGINADWINTGALTVKDTDGNIVFQADIESGTVTMSGDHVRIGNQSATEAISSATETAEEALEAAANARSMTMTLDNDYQTISVDADGKYTSFPECTTTPTVMYGTNDVTADCSYTITKSDSISGSWNNTTRTYTVTALTADSGWVSIKATYLQTMSIVKRFSLAKLYAGEKGDAGESSRLYQLEASTNIFKMGNTDTADISPGALVFNAYYRDAENSPLTSYAGRFVIESTTDGSTWSTEYTSSEDEATVTYDFYAALGVDSSGSMLALDSGKTTVLAAGAKSLDTEEIRCNLYAAGGTDILLDTTIVDRVVDVNTLTQDDIYNLLTNNSQWKGIYKEGNQMYISFTYAKGGTLMLGGTDNGNGVLEVYDGENNLVTTINNDYFKNQYGDEWLTIHESLLSGGHEDTIDGVLDLSQKDSSGNYNVRFESKTGNTILKSAKGFLVELTSGQIGYIPLTSSNMDDFAYEYMDQNGLDVYDLGDFSGGKAIAAMCLHFKKFSDADGNSYSVPSIGVFTTDGYYTSVSDSADLWDIVCNGETIIE